MTAGVLWPVGFVVAHRSTGEIASVCERPAWAGEPYFAGPEWERAWVWVRRGDATVVQALRSELSPIVTLRIYGEGVVLEGSGYTHGQFLQGTEEEAARIAGLLFARGLSVLLYRPVDAVGTAAGICIYAGPAGKSLPPWT